MTNEEIIKRIEEVQIIIRAQHMCKSMDDGCTAEEVEDYKARFEALKLAKEALGKIDEIIKILDDTDFHNAESLNEIGEDKGYHEAICAISLEADRKYRWLYD